MMYNMIGGLLFIIILLQAIQVVQNSVEIQILKEMRNDKRS